MSDTPKDFNEKSKPPSFFDEVVVEFIPFILVVGLGLAAYYPASNGFTEPSSFENFYESIFKAPTP